MFKKDHHKALDDEKTFSHRAVTVGSLFIMPASGVSDKIFLFFEYSVIGPHCFSFFYFLQYVSR